MSRSEEHTSELQSRRDLVCRLLLEKKKKMLTGTITKQEFKLILSRVKRFSVSLINSTAARVGPVSPSPYLLFFFNDTATTEIYTLSLHDALPILSMPARPRAGSPSANPSARRWS